MNAIVKLRKLIVVLFCVSLLFFIVENIIAISFILFNKDILNFNLITNFKPSTASQVLIIIKLCAFGIIVYGLFFLIRILFLNDLSDYYNNNIAVFLKKSGLLIIFGNLIVFLISFSPFFVNPRNIIFLTQGSKYLSLLMIVFGLILIVFSKILEKGTAFKQENDLTI